MTIVKKHKDINEISNCLNECIEKGNTLKNKLNKSYIRFKRRELRKAISFNPMNPVNMNEDVAYYSPYKQSSDGSYQPYSADYWLSQIETNSFKNRRDYREGYEHLREYFKSEQSAKDMLNKSISETVKNKIVVKSKNLPVGTIHEWHGVKMKKVSEGKGMNDWQPVSNEKTHPAEQELVGKKTKIEEELSAREKGKPEPKSNDDKENDIAERESSLDEREKQLEQREQKHAHKELDSRTKEVEKREKEVGIKTEKTKDKKQTSPKEGAKI